MTYTILDLFCGAGGAAKGYMDAGFEVIGIDVKCPSFYPGRFDQEDWLKGLELWVDDVDAIHASPPRQGYSDLAAPHPEIDYPKLINPVRQALQATGLPYIIENVEGAPLIDPVMLCATTFPGTMVEWDGETYQLQRHRLFETNWPLTRAWTACNHRYRTFPVYGHGYPNNMPWFRGAPMAKFAREVMQCEWMTRDEFCEAIPPYYTARIGRQLIEHLNSTSNQEAA